ncbi:TPA: hypothetical protein ACH3X1_011086 [Trebouxia sp. C0004]
MNLLENMSRSCMSLAGLHQLTLLCIVSAAGLISAQSSPELLLQGRFGGAINSQTGLGSLPLLFSWPSSSVYTTFTGTSVTVTIAGSAPTTDSAGYNRFAFFVDQSQVAIESSTPGNPAIKWEMSGLGAGAHNLTITKLNEASYGEAMLESIVLSSNGSFLTPVLPEAFETGRRIQFIGDSYTVGYANTGGTTNCNKTVCFPVGPCVPELDSQNAAVSWGPLTAANFQADYEVIAWSGAGVGTFSVPESNVDATLPTWIGESQYPTDGEIFLRQVAADNTSMVSNFSSWVPQVVVLAGGTNDFHILPPPALEDWLLSYMDLINMINEEYDNPEIIIQVFPLEVNFEGVLTPNATTNYLQYMASVYTATQMEGMTNVHFLQLNAVGMNLNGWCSNHPSAAADMTIAAQLTAYIEAVLPAWTIGTYPLATEAPVGDSTEEA